MGASTHKVRLITSQMTTWGTLSLPEPPVASSCDINLVRAGSAYGGIWLRFVVKIHKPHGCYPTPAILLRVHERRPRLLQASSRKD
jgi:hypothetical protein